MEEIIIDYYSKFEGEPEIQFIRRPMYQDRVIIKIWIGYFDNIMNEIKPKSTGWKALAYYYHLYEGWYDESPWKIPDVHSALKQFQEINTTPLDAVTKEVYHELCKLLENAFSSNDDVYIVYY